MTAAEVEAVRRRIREHADWSRRRLSRFKDACYRAANWIRVGRTRSRTRNDREHRIEPPVTEVYLYPQVKNFREALRDDLS